MSSRHLQRTKIRQLRRGEPIPEGQPARYRSDKGYIRLRWKVGVYSYVETYEHRIVSGFVGEHTHHKNEVKDDNRRENLAPLSRLEHAAEHSRVDFKEAAALYASGWSLPRLAKKYGVGNVTVMRFLKRRGVKMRTLTEAWKVRRAS